MLVNTHRLPNLRVSEHVFRVPLDYARPHEEELSVFARAVVSPAREEGDLPWLIYFQGGPGFGAIRPDAASGWLKRALKEFRVLLLDERGTGLSTPATHQTLGCYDTPEAQAAYLTHFRQDNIVRDAEFIRHQLLGEGERWTALGQSFGGFCVTRYLSAAPEGLKAAILTGGLPPLARHVDAIYRATYRRVLAKNRRYHERYPADAALAREIVSHLDTHEVTLPGGGVLSSRRFQTLGIAFGASDGFERVHYLLESAFVQGRAGRELSYAFLRGVENASSFETNPIYALLHEAEYCQEEASAWSAERIRAEFAEFDVARVGPVFLTGEMVYPWMFEEYERLRPLRAAAEILAQYPAWPRLYDPDRLRANSVPTAAAIYFDDMYVERAFSEETAGTIGGIRTWVTNEYEHNGLRVDGERILDRLLGMARGEI